MWGRPFLEDEDATALHTSVSRTRSLLPRGLDLVALAGGAYALEPAWEAHVPDLAPLSGHPLAPLGRDTEAARVRTLLWGEGIALLQGPPGGQDRRLGVPARPLGLRHHRLGLRSTDLGPLERGHGLRSCLLELGDLPAEPGQLVGPRPRRQQRSVGGALEFISILNLSCQFEKVNVQLKPRDGDAAFTNRLSRR